MPDLRAAVVVVVIASATGAVLARRAGAVVVEVPPDVATPATPASMPPAPAAALLDDAPSPSAHEDEDQDRDDTRPEGPASPSDDEPVAPTQPAPSHAAVPSQDGMLRLPGGPFVVGSASSRAPANERPVHPATVPPFWIDRTEVTVAAYRACVTSGACDPPARTSAACTFETGDAELPISCVHWHDAEAFCRFAGKRLPSELEWEYAARGAFAIPFPWGSNPACANAVTLVNEQSGHSCARRPARVGTHPGGASVFGVQDMSGNVEEWTADWYTEVLGPSPRAGAAHVLRGGGWLSPPSMSRTTSRDWGSALEAGPNVGMRCAKDD